MLINSTQWTAMNWSNFSSAPSAHSDARLWPWLCPSVNQILVYIGHYIYELKKKKKKVTEKSEKKSRDKWTVNYNLKNSSVSGMEKLKITYSCGNKTQLLEQDISKY